jgi:hypothetical protein
METWVWIAIAAGAAVLAVLVAMALVRQRQARRRAERLRAHFGPEYDHAVEQFGSRKSAEAELEARLERRARLEIAPIDAESRQRFLEAWEDVQAKFVDTPAASFGLANGLVVDAMRERGYPIEDFDQRAADLSVDHPDLVENYRAAREVYVANDEGRAETEDLRQAMVHLRAIMSELLDADLGETRSEEPKASTVVTAPDTVDGEPIGDAAAERPVELTDPIPEPVAEGEPPRREPPAATDPQSARVTAH